jgi:hypothetical protein
LRRIELIGAAVPLGLATGLAAWLLAGGLSVRANTLEAGHAKLVGLRPPASVTPRSPDIGPSALLGTPLFALTTGPGAVREPSIRVDGITLTSRRRAALIAIDAKPAAWLSVGESAEGVTLHSVTASAVSVETALGVKTVALGEQSAASSPPPGAPPPAAQAAVSGPDTVPPGFRSPPEPASASRPR